MSSILRNLGDDMAAIFGRHPDHERVHFIADQGDTAGDGWAECETCGELFPEGGESECALCVEDGQARYRGEHDSGAER